MDEQQTNWNNWMGQDKFFEKFPFDIKNPMKNMQVDLSSVDDYVKNIISQVNPSNILYPDFFETHRFLIAKIKIPANIHFRSLNVHLSRTHIKIDGLPGKSSQELKLPTHVDTNDCRALFKKGLLQLKMRKLNWDESYREVYVRY